VTVLSSGPADLWLLHIGRYHDGLHVQSLAPEDEDQDQSSRPTDLQLRGRNENTAFVLSNSECSSCIVPRTYIQLVSWSSHYSNAVCLYRLRELHISGRETLDTGNSCKRSQQQIRIIVFPTSCLYPSLHTRRTFLCSSFAEPRSRLPGTTLEISTRTSQLTNRELRPELQRLR